jgi:CheY-like chemotaxis protein
MPESSKDPVLPNRHARPSAADAADTPTLRRRVRELEDLCAELYEAGVVIGLPQPLLNRLWTVAAHGNPPHTFDIDVSGETEAAPLPDIRIVHDPQSARAFAPPKPLPALSLRRTILVVDDDPAILQLVLKILSYENYEVIAAASGPLALKEIEQLGTPLDLLVTDYVMPAMNGRQLATRLREQYPDLKVLYQTGFTDLLFDQRPEVETNAAFIEKPFSARGLQEAARLLLFKSLQPEALRIA